jgi:hypothetical protein
LQINDGSSTTDPILIPPASVEVSTDPINAGHLFNPEADERATPEEIFLCEICGDNIELSGLSKCKGEISFY